MGLRQLLFAGGAVATAAGLDTALRGARSVAGERDLANPRIESELRFYGAVYAAYGIAVMTVAPRVRERPAAVRAIAATLFGAGLARAGGWRAVGPPHPFQRFLVGVELTLPPAMVASIRNA